MDFSKNDITKELKVNTMIAEKQEQYLTLPSHHSRATGQVAFAIELSEEDIAKVIANKKIYVYMSTYGNPLQPIRVDVDEELFMESWRYTEELIVKEQAELLKKQTEALKKMPPLECNQCKQMVSREKLMKFGNDKNDSIMLICIECIKKSKCDTSKSVKVHFNKEVSR